MGGHVGNGWCSEYRIIHNKLKINITVNKV